MGSPLVELLGVDGISEIGYSIRMSDVNRDGNIEVPSLGYWTFGSEAIS